MRTPAAIWLLVAAAVVSPACVGDWNLFSISGGVVAGARTDGEDGAGAMVAVGLDDSEGEWWSILVRYEEIELTSSTVARVSYEIGGVESGEGWGMPVLMGWGVHWSRSVSGDWGTGPKVGMGYGFQPNDHFGLFITGDVYAWLGGDGGKFGAGLQGTVGLSYTIRM